MTPSEMLPAAVLERKALIYIRQSCQAQLKTNLESRRRQYELVEVARRQGFRSVEVIDDDVGRSASGLSLTAEDVSFPRPSDGRRITCLKWTAIRCRNVISIMMNPFYAGAYVYGKSEKRVSVVDGRAGKTYGHGRPRAAWDVLIRDHHNGYIGWDEFERNQKTLAANTPYSRTLTPCIAASIYQHYDPLIDLDHPRKRACVMASKTPPETTMTTRLPPAPLTRSSTR